MVCFVFVACCWVSRAARLLFYRITPYLVSRIADCWLVGVVCWGGVLCENCIVDANAIIINGNGNNLLLLFVFLFCGFVLGIFCCLCVKNVLCFLF